jgi:hypothetical protein
LVSAFEIYLRTGRRVAPASSAVENKFNPWHDPDDGRFTFAGQGRYVAGYTGSRLTGQRRGLGGRGGSFGGGGAGGSWEPSPLPTPAASSKRPRVPTPTTSAGAASLNRPAQGQRLKIPKNGYSFSIDAHVRPRQISGELQLKLEARSRRAQLNAGKPDRRDTDDGGHFVAARFNGPRAWFNHFAQDANFNRGAYRALEDKWAKAVRSGKRVFVDIVPHYRGTSMRPYLLWVTWTIDGRRARQRFTNEKGGK